MWLPNMAQDKNSLGVTISKFYLVAHRLYLSLTTMAAAHTLRKRLGAFSVYSFKDITEPGPNVIASELFRRYKPTVANYL
jgi:hypothetical protein